MYFNYYYYYRLLTCGEKIAKKNIYKTIQETKLK